MNKMDEALYLWAQWGILNYEQYQAVLSHFGDLERAWGKITPSFLEQMGMGREKAERIFEIREGISFHELVTKFENLNIQILCIDDTVYPPDLKTIHNPPPFLFVRGKLPSFHKAIGVVGTRDITNYGQFACEKLTADLVRNGFTIVSGLALGIDACAHETCLRRRGTTVAVLGSGVDFLYPPQNAPLAERILASGGAVVSEYPLGTPGFAHHFPARNRIISGLSRGLLVIEGGIKSGALITARLALEQGREVFAVPNNIHKISLSGTNHLIRKGEAKLVESVKDILEEFNMTSQSEQSVMELNLDETTLLNLVSKGGRTADELLAETGLSVSKLSEQLVCLTLKGAIREEGAKWVLS